MIILIIILYFTYKILFKYIYMLNSIYNYVFGTHKYFQLTYIYLLHFNIIYLFFGTLVTHYDLASNAISMLTNEITKIDLVIANITSPDVLNLLQLAVRMEIPTICKLFNFLQIWTFSFQYLFQFISLIFHVVHI